MKTNQFIKEIKSMGFKIKKIKDYFVVIDANGFCVSEISEEYFGVFSTDYVGFHILGDNTKLQLLDLLIEYAKTPIEDREEEEKFKLKQKGVSEKYLMWMPASNHYVTSSKPFSKFIFTQSEIDRMPECYKHPAVWEKIKVERED